MHAAGGYANGRRTVISGRPRSSSAAQIARDLCQYGAGPRFLRDVAHKASFGLGDHFRANLAVVAHAGEMQDHPFRSGAHHGVELAFLAGFHFVGGAVVEGETEIGKRLNGSSPHRVLGRREESLLRAVRSPCASLGVAAAC